jgi:hypothetical protein
LPVFLAVPPVGVGTDPGVKIDPDAGPDEVVDVAPSLVVYGVESLEPTIDSSVAD